MAAGATMGDSDHMTSATACSGDRGAGLEAFLARPFAGRAAGAKVDDFALMADERRLIDTTAAAAQERRQRRSPQMDCA